MITSRRETKRWNGQNHTAIWGPSSLIGHGLTYRIQKTKQNKTKKAARGTYGPKMRYHHALEVLTTLDTWWKQKTTKWLVMPFLKKRRRREEKEGEGGRGRRRKRRKKKRRRRKKRKMERLAEPFTKTEAKPCQLRWCVLLVRVMGVEIVCHFRNQSQM